MVPSDSRAVKLCPSCGTPCAADDRFCAGCGVSLETRPPDAEEEPKPVSCPACGTPHAVGDRFCAVCGASLETPPPDAEEEPEPESCPACGTPCAPDDRFCATCGATLQIRPPDTEPETELESCPACGAPRHDDAAFCSTCGTQFRIAGSRATSSREGKPGAASSSSGTQTRTHAPEGASSRASMATLLNSKPRMLAVASSVFVMLSTQMTWISVSLLGLAMGFAAADISGGLVVNGLLCGIAAMGVTFTSSSKTRAGTYLLTGVVCLLVLAVVWSSEMSIGAEMGEFERALAEELQSLATQREGFYFYILGAVGLLVAGIAEWPGLLRATGG